MSEDVSNTQTQFGRSAEAACNAAAEELRATRRFVELIEGENALLKERLETEKRSASLLAALNESRRGETEALREAVAAKNEAMQAKDAVIDAQAKMIESLKTKRSSPWKRLGDILIGAAAAAVFR